MAFFENQNMNCFGMIVGILIIIGAFFGGLMLLLGTEDVSGPQVILFMMVIPAIGAISGIAIILYSMKDTITGAGLFSKGVTPTTKESFIHIPPSVCTSCKAGLSSENIEWVGPLTVKCPYCGATHPTVKRKV